MKKVKKKISEAERRQRERYQLSIKLDPENDKDIIKRLDQVDKKQTFVKECIRNFDKLYQKV